jgi:beta-glucanase (GH16 family)
MSDDFNGGALDPALWHTCYWWSELGCTNLGNKELEWYLPDNVHVDGGAAHLVARREGAVGADGLPFAYTSGMISQAAVDRDLFKFTYGFAEARVRVPAGSGLWSAFWMLPASRESKPEMDIFEVVGENPRRTVMHSHWQGGDDGDESIKQIFDGPDFSSGWHTFGLDWEPESLTFYVDGVVRWTVTDPNAIPHEPMYLLADLAVGGTFTAGVKPSTPFPSELALDYVKVWRAR